jgi:uncharacterized protein
VQLFEWRLLPIRRACAMPLAPMKLHRLIAPLILALMPLAAQADTPPLRPALWKITRGHTTIWLFGTIHMLPPGANWLTGPIAHAADTADEIATEIDDPDGSRTRAALSTHAMLPKGETLSSLIDDDTRKAMSEELARYGLTPDRLDTNKPWYAAVALSMLPMMQRGYSVHSGVEAGLTAREAKRHVPHTAIETPDSQLGVLDGLPQATQITYLHSVITEFDTIDTLIDAMYAAWGKGDATELARLMNEDEGKDDPLLLQRLIYDRNKTFANWIEQRLARPGTVFMAVGAGHLAGTGSVQDLLAQDGIRAERVQ